MLDYKQIPGFQPFKPGEPHDDFFTVCEGIRAKYEFSEEWLPYADQWYLSLEMILKSLFDQEGQNREVGVDLLATVLKMAQTIKPACSGLESAGLWIARTAGNLLPEGSRDGSQPAELAPALALLSAGAAYHFRDRMRTDFKLLFVEGWFAFYADDNRKG